ncbi:MAG: outer membrane protein assembly factor BamB [Thiotrichales bacterium]|nr:outer membrane protein assembly factor BamB [Thiotrichales bacterium]
MTPFAGASFARALLVSSALVLLGGCSSTIELQEPPKEPLNSELTLAMQWTIKQSSMPNLDTRGLDIAQDDKVIFVANTQGYLTKLLKQPQSRWTDQVVWETQFDEVLTAGPTLDEKFDRVLLGTAKGRLKAIDGQTGQLQWQQPLSSEVLGRPLLHKDVIFTRTVDGKVYALNRAEGSVIWVAEHQMPTLSLRGAPEIIANDNQVFVAWETGIVQALSRSSGELIWESRVAVPSGRTDLERMVDIQANLVLHDGVLYALGFHGKMAAINPQNGNFIFVNELSGYRDFVIDDEAVYLVDENDVLYALDAKSGASLWRQESMKGRFIGDLAFYKDQLLLTDSWGYVHWVNKVQGTVSSRFKHSNDYGDGNKIVRVRVDGEVIYLFDAEGQIRRYQVRTSDLATFTKQHGDGWF